MTDKQIIIDGVDVSGCPHIEYEHKWWNMAGHEQNSENVCALSFDKNADFEEDFLCQDNPNCYYKQSKRKEQECEELKKGCSELTDIVSPYMDDFTGYNEELGGFDIVLCVKELMEQLEAYKMEAEEGKEINAELKAENENWQKEYWKLEQGNDFLAETNSRLKQTLTEIKEIADFLAPMTDEYENCLDRDRCFECDFTEDCLYFNIKQILQKISECEVGDE